MSEENIDYKRVIKDLQCKYEEIISMLENRIEELSRRDDPTGKWIA